ncbi:MAG TPA: hypothetical protein VHI77_07810 [Solirubrobacterales bacterium]|nr:hypothetical protein [Solirubrobacterales bacterium]
MILFDLMMVATTALFTVIALGPDSLLDECSNRSYSRCVGSHGQAGAFAIASGVITLIFLGMTWQGIRSGRLTKRPPSGTEPSSEDTDGT